MISRKPHIIGKPFPLIEAQRKLTGRSCYAGDEKPRSGQLYARILFSERPHARFQLHHVEAARSAPGVAALLTGQDLATRLGAQVEDRELLATAEVLYVGQPLAVVAAETPEAAEAALARIQVTYEDLPAVFDIEEALQGRVQVHPHWATYRGTDALQGDPRRNLAHTLRFRRGEPEDAMARAHVVVEHAYTTAPLHHAPLETHGAVAHRRGDQIVMWVHTQAPFLQRAVIARALKLPLNQVRLIGQCVGGSFGGKVHVSIEGLLAAIAREVDRPVRLHLTREEEFSATFITPAMRAWIRMAADAQGRLVALQAVYDWNVGASVDLFLHQLESVLLAGTGPYVIPNVSIEVNAIYTHLPPAAPMRGLSLAHVHWAVEQHMDELAERVGMPPVDFRLWNLVKGGDKLFPHFVMHATGLESCAWETTKAIDWHPEAIPTGPNAMTGQGMALGWSPILIMPGCKNRVTIQCDGEDLCTVIVDGMDVGQGYYAFITQLIAFELNIPVEWISVLPTDTDAYEPEWQAVYQNLLWSTGRALLRATQELKRQVLSYVSEMWEEPVTNLDIVEGDIISYATRRRMSFRELLERGSGQGAPLVFRATGEYAASTDGGALDQRLQAFAATGYAAEVTVNMKTGHFVITQLAGAVDVGHALNPEGVRAQLKGGLVQGISTTVLEKMEFEDGRPISTDFMHYPIATTADLPRKLYPVVVEVPQSTGPYGARDVSNHVIIGAAAAIGNAIYRATGVRIRDLPITAQKVYDALQRAEKGQAP